MVLQSILVHVAVRRLWEGVGSMVGGADPTFGPTI